MVAFLCHHIQQLQILFSVKKFAFMAHPVVCLLYLTGCNFRRCEAKRRRLMNCWERCVQRITKYNAICQFLILFVAAVISCDQQCSSHKLFEQNETSRDFLSARGGNENTGQEKWIMDGRRKRREHARGRRPTKRDLLRVDVSMDRTVLPTWHRAQHFGAGWFIMRLSGSLEKR